MLENHEGTVTLTPVKKPEPRTVYAKLVRKNGRLIFQLPKGYTLAEGGIEQALRETRVSEAERGYKP